MKIKSASFGGPLDYKGKLTGEMVLENEGDEARVTFTIEHVSKAHAQRIGQRMINKLADQPGGTRIL